MRYAKSLQPQEHSSVTFQHIIGCLLIQTNYFSAKIGLNHAESRVLNFLLGYYNVKQNRAFPTMTLMAERCKMSFTTLIKCLERLVKLNLLLIVKLNKNNRQVYYINIKKIQKLSKSGFTACDKTGFTACDKTHDKLIENELIEKNIIHTSVADDLFYEDDDEAFKTFNESIQKLPSEIQEDFLNSSEDVLPQEVKIDENNANKSKVEKNNLTNVVKLNTSQSAKPKPHKTEYEKNIEKVCKTLKSWNVLDYYKFFDQYGLESVIQSITYVESLEDCYNPGAYLRKLLASGNIPQLKKKKKFQCVEPPKNIEDLMKAHFWKHKPSGEVLRVKDKNRLHRLFGYNDIKATVQIASHGYKDEPLSNFDPSTEEEYRKYKGMSSDNLFECTRDEAQKWCQSIHPGGRPYLKLFKKLVEHHGFTEEEIVYQNT